MSSPPHLAFSRLDFYLRLFLYVFSHANWTHLFGNLTIILLVGPLLEEKYGSWKIFEMMALTAAATALVNAAFFSSSIIGGSGLAFMMILLSSFSNFSARQIPLTFILVAVIYLGAEMTAILKADQISQFSHLAGGGIGALYGFFRGGLR